MSPERARTLGLAIWRPNFPDFPQTPRLLATRIDMTIDCLVPSMAASQARRSSSSSALDFAIAASLLLLRSSSFSRGSSKEKAEEKVESVLLCSK